MTMRLKSKVRMIALALGVAIILMNWSTLVASPVPNPDPDFFDDAGRVLKKAKDTVEDMVRPKSPVENFVDKSVDVITGKRDAHLEFGEGGVRVTTSYTQEEWLLIIGGGLIGLMVVVCCCVSCCRK